MASIRAAQLKEDLLALRDMGAALDRRVRADVPAEFLEAVEAATRVEWLPLAIHQALTESIRAHGGDDGLRAWACAAALRSAGSSLWGPIVEPLLRRLGPDPLTLLRVPPLAYATTYRGMGTMKLLSSAPRRARLGLFGVPPALATETFLITLSGAVLWAFVQGGVEGRAEPRPGADGADAVFEASWAPIGGERPAQAAQGRRPEAQGAGRL